MFDHQTGQTNADLKSSPFLEINLLQPRVSMTEGEDGALYLESLESLNAYPHRLTTRLKQWAKEKADATFMAQRDENEEWVHLTYGEALQKASAVSQFLLDHGLTTEKPLAILSGNSLEQAVMILGALHAGIPFSPISAAYSIKSTDFAKLKHCIQLLTPGIIFVQDSRMYANALSVLPPEIPVVSVTNTAEHQYGFNEVLSTKVTEDVEKAHQNIKPETIAKILFTSGSTGAPKGVINTHGNITANHEQNIQSLPFILEHGFHLIDWLPWNHTFGGNSNFGLALYTGGSLYIDDGNPSPAGMQKTIRNLREIAPTIYYNVPKGFEELLPYLRSDKELCRFFFSRLKMFFYAGANMSQKLWDALEQLSLDTIGKRLFIGTGLGMTESSPSAMFNTRFGSAPGRLGLPVPGLTLKLAPMDGRYEARYKGPNLTPGYWRNPEATTAAFDEEGFFKTGDAVKFLDPEDLSKGLLFDGRIAENFKLESGTWVNVGNLRSKLVAASHGLIADAVITGHDRDYVGAILIPDLQHCSQLANLPAETSLAEIVHHPKVVAALKDIIDELGNKGTGSSTYVKKAVFADFSLSADMGEITDKGSINQRNILTNRAHIVAQLYSPDSDHPGIVEFKSEK